MEKTNQPTTPAQKMIAEALNKILIEGLKLYAYHGVLEQERTIGAYFTIDAEIYANFSQAIDTDELAGTIDYSSVYQTIKREMGIPSQLIEHVAGRIAKAILAEHPSAQSVKLKIIKENPPMGADCKGAGIEITIHK